MRHTNKYLMRFIPIAALAVMSIAAGCGHKVTFHETVDASPAKKSLLPPDTPLLLDKFEPYTETDAALKKSVLGHWVWNMDSLVYLDFHEDGSFSGVLDSYMGPSLHIGLDYSGKWDVRQGMLWTQFLGNVDNHVHRSLQRITLRKATNGEEMVLENSLVDDLKIYERHAQDQ